MLSRQGSVGASQGGACQHSTLVIHLATNDAAKESAWALAEPVEPAALPAPSAAGQMEVRGRRQGGVSSCDVARLSGIRFRSGAGSAGGAGVARGAGSAGGAGVARDADVACGAGSKGVARLAGIRFRSGAGSAGGACVARSAGVACGACGAAGKGVARLAGIFFGSGAGSASGAGVTCCAAGEGVARLAGIRFGSGAGSACAADKSLTLSAAGDGQQLGIAASNTNCTLCHPILEMCCVQSYRAHLCTPSLKVLTYVIRARLRLLCH